MESNGRIFSGIQPTGNLHLGNYLGAIQNWVKLQNDYECLFCIVDLHAITVPQDPATLRQSIRQTAAAYIASGIDPKKSIIFQQSAVSGHSELGWLLMCLTPLGWLNRMTQFKEKAGKDKEKACLGLYAYPVLMASDILLYHATHVPVGEDQKQHLELCRDIAGAFNRQYGQEYFKLPEPLILGEATRVMSLRDGRSKMSKSDASDYSRIHLSDSDDIIRAKIQKAKSDMDFAGITYDPEKRPEASNLLTIMAAIQGKSRKDIENQYLNSNFSSFKKDVSDALVAHIAPIRSEMEKLLEDTAYLDKLLAENAQKSDAMARDNLNKIQRLIGFL